jgi:glycosyltransferase involved in cell wall biosynthesis
MKILLYNWINFDDKENRGGGVRVYQANLISELTRLRDARVYTLSSGVSYDLFSSRVYIRKRSERHGVVSYEVVNSPIAAPAHSAFYSLDVYLHDERLKAVVKDFLKAHGPFDVIHLDNLEGLTAGVLGLKEEFPETRFIYYMHNYSLFCPQVNLWYAETEACNEYNDGKRCEVCLPHRINMRQVKIAHAISRFLQRIGIKYDSFIFRTIYRHIALAKKVLVLIRRLAARIRPEHQTNAVPAHSAPDAHHLIKSTYSTRSAGRIFQQYRAANLFNMNNNFDHVLAVSNRVKEMAVHYGVEENRVTVNYIGSRFAPRRAPIRVRDNDHLKIAYMGYERKDKGFYHFVEALEAMPRSVSRRLSVLMAAKLQSQGILERLKRLSVEFGEFEIVDGYTHDGLTQLLSDVDLGIVPVLWEDNLPQVAIEFVAHGVPVLSSDLGGAKELCGANRRFVYRHGNVDAFINKIIFFLNHRSELSSYEDQALKFMEMKEHVNIMVRRFYSPSAGPMTLLSDDREVRRSVSLADSL